jgi:hypothetical protein
MRHIAGVITALLVSGAAFAQNYSGTFTTKNEQGGTVTLSLKQDGASNVKGTLTGNDNTFQVEAKATPQGLMGKVSGPQGQLYLIAQFEGEGLTVVLAEPMANGQPNLGSARRIVFNRAGAGSAAKAEKPAAGGGDGALTTLLTRNAWCGFTYNQHSGTSTSERVVFGRDGMVSRSSGAQTYNSGAAGSVAGQYGNAERGRWKVANGMLHLSADGTNWTPQPLQVTQNSNGYPIIKSGGKEYMQCN